MIENSPPSSEATGVKRLCVLFCGYEMRADTRKVISPTA